MSQSWTSPLTVKYPASSFGQFFSPNEGLLFFLYKFFAAFHIQNSENEKMKTFLSKVLALERC
jgi:hypothetical protein